MGLSNFHFAADGLLPILVMNTVFTVALLRNMVRSLIGATGYSNLDEESDGSSNSRERRISITQFKALCSGGGSGVGAECCVCLCRFEAEEEVSELACKHFFHKNCLEKWFDNKNSFSCPLCRSTR